MKNSQDTFTKYTIQVNILHTATVFVMYAIWRVWLERFGISKRGFLSNDMVTGDVKLNKFCYTYYDNIWKTIYPT